MHIAYAVLDFKYIYNEPVYLNWTTVILFMQYIQEKTNLFTSESFTLHFRDTVHLLFHGFFLLQRIEILVHLILVFLEFGQQIVNTNKTCKMSIETCN